MTHPTYCLRPHQGPHQASMRDVRQLADEVIVQASALGDLLSDYGSFVQETGWERRRGDGEYLVEALMLGILWRARGIEAAHAHLAHAGLIATIIEERRAGLPRRRDGSTARLLSPLTRRDGIGGAPSLTDFRHLYEWLWASGEYDDEVDRLTGWLAFLERQPDKAAGRLRRAADLAATFARRSEEILGRGTRRVERFVNWVLPTRPPREDTVQVSRGRLEYHFNMVGAELLNRAWRAGYRACTRHVLVVPACARAHGDDGCKATHEGTELRCTRCTSSCAIAKAASVAEASGTEVVIVKHGSDFGHFLSSPRLAGGDVGITGVACVPGLVGAGWRARARGLPAQCLLLESSGCAHWLDRPRPTALDLDELARLLAPGESSTCLGETAA